MARGLRFRHYHGIITTAGAGLVKPTPRGAGRPLPPGFPRPGLKKRAFWYIKQAWKKSSRPYRYPPRFTRRSRSIIKGTEFGSVSSYAAKVLRESLSKAEPAAEVFTKDEEEKVKERLKALGYID